VWGRLSLLHDPEDGWQGKHLVGIEIVFKRTAINVFHGDIGHAPLLAIIVHGDDIGVVDASGDLRFAFEAGDFGAIAVFVGQ